jgi:hypothetical protein
VREKRIVSVGGDASYACLYDAALRPSEAVSSDFLALISRGTARPPTGGAEHSVAVLLKIYAHCIDGQADAANKRITDALGPRTPGKTLVTRDGDSEQASRNARSEPGSRADGQHNRPTGPVRGRERPVRGPHGPRRRGCMDA